MFTEKRVKLMPHFVVDRDVGRGLRFGSVVSCVVVVVFVVVALVVVAT